MDKKPLQSKKFIAYLIADIGWKIILLYILVQTKSTLEHYTFSVLITLIIVSGFIQVGYILGQAALDKYLKVTDNLVNEKRTSNNDKEV